MQRNWLRDKKLRLSHKLINLKSMFLILKFNKSNLHFECLLNIFQNKIILKWISETKLNYFF